ncbi:unnamed protein product [Urochloa humidicola]
MSMSRALVGRILIWAATASARALPSSGDAGEASPSAMLNTIPDLCLCNTMNGTCRLLPAPDMSIARAAAGPSYVIVTGHDTGSNDNGSVVWILAVNHGATGGMAYQIFSYLSGEWGPAKLSARLPKGTASARTFGHDAVCRGGTVYWLSTSRLEIGLVCRAFAFAMDVRTERTWTMQLPEKHAVRKVDRDNPRYFSCSLTPVTSRDGRLSLIVSLPSPQIEVWVLGGDGRWTLQRRIDVPELLPDHCRRRARPDWLRAYCYSSGCLFADVDERDVVIAVDEDSLCSNPMQQIVHSRVSYYPYEMDYSTFVSKMKYF